MANPFEEAGRQRKASALLVQALREDLTAADVALFDESEWAALAARSSVKVPSEATRTIVVESLGRREGIGVEADPFVGLAS